MKTYSFTLKHDNGTVTIQTRADSVQSAKRSILASEGAPECAILYWSVVPTKQQVAKTKSLLRCI